MSSLRQSSNLLNDQKTEPNEQYEEVSHVIDSIDHECVQAYDSMCIEDIVHYLGCYHVHLWNHFENEIKRPSQKCPVSSQITWTKWQWRHGKVTEQELHQSLE